MNAPTALLRPRPHLLLLGGGHAHVQVLAAIAREGWAREADITLVTPYARQFYSGMLPGFMVGRYTADECVIPLLPWARAGGVRVMLGRVVALDASARIAQIQVAGEAGPQALSYDLVSIDTGSEMHARALPGAAEHGLLVRPLENFVLAWQEVVRQAQAASARSWGLAVVGSGAAGVELALAARQALPCSAQVALVLGARGVMADSAPAVRRRVERQLRRQGVELLDGACASLHASGLQLRSGAVWPCDTRLIATGGEAPLWLQNARGLALSTDGRIATGPTLQSVSHPHVLAAGDVAVRPDAPHARSGVYAVRAGPALVRNLLRCVKQLTRGERDARDALGEGVGGVGGKAGRVDRGLVSYQPQARALYLLSCGDGSAIATWGAWSLQGRWVWRWKDAIDRGFIARWRAPEDGA